MSHLSVDERQASASSDSLRLPASALALLALTAALSLLVSHYRLLWFDEYLMLNTDGVSSLRQLIHIQRASPISLDPFAYHFFAYLSMRLFGVSAFALRLPSLLGYLLMQVCLFHFVRRIASERAALFAMILPSLLHVEYFAVDGRPYGLQLGLYALVLLCWQTAVRWDPQAGSRRTPALITLAIALGITLNTHYFAFLLLIPLYAAEIFRAMQRRKLDLPMLASLGAATAAIAFVLPFTKGAAVFRDHYIALNVNLQDIPLMYRSLLVFPAVLGEGTGKLAFLVALILAFLWGAVRLVRHPVRTMLKAEYVLLITLTATPLFGYLLAVCVTHSIFERYVICTTLGMIILEAVAVSPLLESRRRSRILLGGMVLVFLAHGVQRLSIERRETKQRLAKLVFSPEIKAEILNSPSGLLYTQDMATFFFTRFYEPDPEIRSRLALVVSREEELRIMHQDTYWLQGTHLAQCADSRTVAYESIAAEPGQHIFIQLHDEFQWINTTLAASQAKVRYLGPAYGPVDPAYAGDFVAVTFPQ
jgi:hypothetical protein